MTTNDRRAPPSPGYPGRTLTAADLAAVLQVSVRTVRRMIAAGEIRAIRVGRSVRVPVEEVSRLLKPR